VTLPKTGLVTPCTFSPLGISWCSLTFLPRPYALGLDVFSHNGIKSICLKEKKKEKLPLPTWIHEVDKNQN
jgi:hypothetical protein